DVAYYCRSCSSCQKSSSKGVLQAPLVPLPIVATPFKWIAIDIVGPLPKSRSGKQYILVICDYATRFLEAIPMKSIDAAHITEELLHLFARVGVQEEMLTDQWSNFTSQLLTEIYQMLRVRPIRTTRYHPQTDGLVERFNGTLKSMLRKAVTKEGKDWDKLIPYLLFAYQEVPQASMGFSPLELLYRRT
uniref:Integrase catalytic domain-containing protein n=1 Tax=Amphimedon queenslandica TaxID=400682 RepID=A0A1X7UTB7_AMPQE